MTATNGLLKMSELAERSGVNAGTIKHYLREGVLGGQDDVVPARDPGADQPGSAAGGADDRAGGQDPGAGD